MASLPAIQIFKAVLIKPYGNRWTMAKGFSEKQLKKSIDWAEKFLKEVSQPMDIETALAEYLKSKQFDSYSKEIDASFHFLEGFKAATQWIDVNERLPEEDGVYLAYDSVARKVRRAAYRKGKLSVTSGIAIGKLTHWTPLPLPPMEGDE